MTFRFRIGRSIAKEARRVALAQVDRSIRTLTTGIDVDSGIHECRKSLKRLRALIRILRPGLEPAWYRETDAGLRNIGRGLSGSRDRFVAATTLAAIEARAGHEPGAFASVLPPATRDANGDEARLQDAMAATRHAADALSRLRGEFATLSRREIGEPDVVGGFRRTYANGRRDMGTAFAASTDEPVHEWRKSVQRHWRHLQLVERVWPDELAARIREARRISELIGEHQDLTVLKSLVRAAASRHRGRHLARKVIGLAQQRQADILALVRPHGERLFADKPGDLARRIALYWQATTVERSLGRPEPDPPRSVKR